MSLQKTGSFVVYARAHGAPEVNNLLFEESGNLTCATAENHFATSANQNVTVLVNYITGPDPHENPVL
jgi:hypothetical protein